MLNTCKGLELEHIPKLPLHDPHIWFDHEISQSKTISRKCNATTPDEPSKEPSQNEKKEVEPHKKNLSQARYDATDTSKQN